MRGGGNYWVAVLVPTSCSLPMKACINSGWRVGTNAAQMAAGMGAEVLITDINLTRLRYLSEVLPKNVKTLYSSMHNIRMELPNIDLVIGSVLIPEIKRHI